MTFLICGLGSIGRRHLRVLKSFGEHNYIAYRSSKKSDKDKDVNDEIYDLKDLQNLKIDGALITNPTSLHIETAIEIAKHGIPLFIEKPLGKNLERIEELQALTEKQNLSVLIGYNLLYHPAIVSIEKLIEEKKIGKIISAKAQFGTFMPGWHIDEDYKKSYAANTSMGGGAVLTSIHEQNYLTYLFGDVTNIKAMEVGGNVIGIDAEEGVEILIKHNSGVVSNVHLNFFQKPYYRNLQLIGTEGTIFWDFMIPEIKILKKENTEVIKLGNDAMELLDISYINQMKHFIDIIEKKSEPKINLTDGINDMKVALKILKETGRNCN